MLTCGPDSSGLTGTQDKANLIRIRLTHSAFAGLVTEKQDTKELGRNYCRFEQIPSLEPEAINSRLTDWNNFGLRMDNLFRDT